MHFGILLGGYLTYKKPNKPSKATKSQKNFCSSFSEPIIERIKTELWQDLGVLSTLRWKKLYQSNTRYVDSLSLPFSTNNQSHTLFIPASPRKQRHIRDLDCAAGGKFEN